MKFNLTLLLLVCSLAVRAASPTNTVTIDSLTTASTPLAGTEKVVLYQGGMKSATVAQVIAAATSQINSTSNNLQTQITAEVSARAAQVTAASNLLWNIALTNSQFCTAVSNYFGAVTSANAAGTAAASNFLYTVISTNTTAIAALNAAGYQTAAQVVAAVNSGIAATLSGNTNNSAVTYGTVTATNLITPQTKIYNVTNTVTVDVDMAAGNFQLINYQLTAAATLTLRPVNAANGQNVSLLIYNLSTRDYHVAPAVYSTNKLFAPSTGNLNVSSGGYNAAAQIQMFGTNAVVSYGVL
jgi:hypothetical protein